MGETNIFSERHKVFSGQHLREDWCVNLKTKQKYQNVMRKQI